LDETELHNTSPLVDMSSLTFQQRVNYQLNGIHNKDSVQVRLSKALTKNNALLDFSNTLIQQEKRVFLSPQTPSAEEATKIQHSRTAARSARRTITVQPVDQALST
jgi:hypothetical protein